VNCELLCCGVGPPRLRLQLMRPLSFVLLLLISSGCCMPPIGRLPKRRQSSNAEASSASLLSRIAEMLNLWTPAHVYNMDVEGSRNELIDALWTGEYLSAVGRFSSVNAELVSFFEELQLDGSTADHRFWQLTSTWPRFEGVLRQLFRARSQKLVPLETAALSVYFLHQRVPHAAWNAVAQMSRNVMSWTWTIALCDDAVQRDPGPQYATARGMTAAVFDNFMMKVGYGSYGTQESSAHTIEMTNWATVFLPTLAVPADFSIDTMLGSSGIFRVDRALSDFIDLFSPIAPDLVANKRQRWSSYLDSAAAGHLWEKVPFASPYPQTRFEYHEPIFDHLQSSYADVNFEVDLMRASQHHKYSDCIQLGGDGLTYMRLIHRLSQDPRRYLETKPVIIPRLGEAPHGKFHVLHGEWRLWAPLLLRMAAIVNNRIVKRDPIVSEFNEHEHFLRIVVEAFAEYVVEISHTGSDYHQVGLFLQSAEANLSFAYVCYFLYLFGFKYLQMRSAIRRNDSATLDKVWRENLQTARTSMANKTNYSQMTISVIYWGWALVEPLQTAFHRTRTIRWLHSHVGWDFPIEMMNCWIKMCVVAHITRDAIRTFIRRLNFTQMVTRGMEAILYARRQDRKEFLKPIDTDKALIKEYLRQAIGADYATATTPSDANLLQVDMADWGGPNRGRQNAPWRQMERDAHDYRDYVRQNVAKLFPWHHWT
jgi:hypothetical protein